MGLLEAKFDSWNYGIFVTIKVENYLHLGHGTTDGNTGLELETCVLPPTGPRITNNGPDTSNPKPETYKSSRYKAWKAQMNLAICEHFLT